MVLKKGTLQVMVCIVLMMLSSVSGMEMENQVQMMQLFMDNTAMLEQKKCERCGSMYYDGSAELSENFEYCESCADWYKAYVEKSVNEVKESKISWVPKILMQAQRLALTSASLYYIVSAMVKTYDYGAIGEYWRHSFVDASSFKQGEFWRAVDALGKDIFSNNLLRVAFVSNIVMTVFFLMSIPYAKFIKFYPMKIPLNISLLYLPSWETKICELAYMMFYFFISFSMPVGHNLLGESAEAYGIDTFHHRNFEALHFLGMFFFIFVAQFEEKNAGIILGILSGTVFIALMYGLGWLLFTMVLWWYAGNTQIIYKIPSHIEFSLGFCFLTHFSLYIMPMLWLLYKKIKKMINKS